MALAIFPVDVTTVTFFSRTGLVIPGNVTTLGATVFIIVGVVDALTADIGLCVIITVRGGPP